jgi:ABC-type nitrate/sulfonate/bicarbonate transport system substrate-binding protein
MTRLVSLLLIAVLAAACAGPAATPAASVGAVSAAVATTAPPRVSLKLCWTSLSGASSGLWTAFESGYFADEGLDVELVNIASSSRAVAALLAKQVQFSHMDGQVIIDADLGGANLKMIYAVNNRLVFSIMTKATITTPADLKGKKLGITAIGSSTHTAALLALSRWGLKADADVPLLALNDVPNILIAMLAGQIDAGVMSPPTNTRAKAAGFRELLNLATDGPEWPSIGLAASAEYLAANPTVGARIVRAYARGVQRFKSDKAFGTNVLRKYLKLDDQAVLDDTWTQYSRYLVEVPYVAGMQNTLDVVGQTRPEAKKLKPGDLIDASYVKALDDAGFFRQLYAK